MSVLNKMLYNFITFKVSMKWSLYNLASSVLRAILSANYIPRSNLPTIDLYLLL